MTILTLFEKMIMDPIKKKAWEEWNIDKEPFVQLGNSSFKTIPESQRRAGEESALSFVVIFRKGRAMKHCRQAEVSGYPVRTNYHIESNHYSLNP